MDPSARPSCSITPTTTSPSISKKTLLFHVFDADSFGETFAAFDNAGKLYVLVPMTAKIPHGKIELQKTYKVRGFKTDGQKVLLENATTISLFPMDFPANKISDNLRTEASMLLQRYGAISIAKAKSEETLIDQAVSVKGKVIRQAATLEFNSSRDGKPFSLQKVWIADKTGNMRLSLFGKKAGTVEKGKTYLFKNVIKSNFQGSNYLKAASWASVITETAAMDGEVTANISEYEEAEIKKDKVTRTITGIQAGSIRWYQRCTNPNGCKNKIENCKCQLPGKNTAIVDFDTHYVQNEEVHHDNIKVFNDELLQLLGRDNFEDIENADALEEFIDGYEFPCIIWNGFSQMSLKMPISVGDFFAVRYAKLIEVNGPFSSKTRPIVMCSWYTIS